jgi:hypothetical protein
MERKRISSGEGEETPFWPVANRNPKWGTPFEATGGEGPCARFRQKLQEILRGKSPKSSRRSDDRLRGGRPAKKARADEGVGLQKGTFS